jgi:hypothetical protein
VTFWTIFNISFELARQDIQRIYYVYLRDFRVDGLVLGLPWLNDE